MGFVVDAHSDMLNDVLARRLMGQTDVLKKRWLPGMKEGGIDLRVTAIYIDSEFIPELALRRALDMAAALLEELDNTPEAVLCRSYGDMVEAEEKGKIGFLMGMEGAEPLGSDLSMLRVFHQLGLRILGLTHARRNALADGAPFFPVKAGRAGGLSDIGVSFLHRAQEMGIIIDVSHLNDPGFWDVMELAQPPVIASHSNARAVHDHPRNLTDEQIKTLADKGGVMGVNADRFIVGGEDLEMLFAHLDHLVKTGGEEHVGLGPDFCDYLLDHMAPSARAHIPEGGACPVKGLEGDREIPRIAEGLVRRGYKPRTVDLIMGHNFKRIFKEVLGDPARSG